MPRALRFTAVFCTTVLITMVLAPTTPTTGADPLDNLVMSEADWILATQLPGGAITTQTDNRYVDPYLAGFAVLGLIEAFETTADRRYAEASWKWLDWYASAQDVNGFVTDYTVAPNGALTSTGDMDSTDSYAAMFLLAAAALYRLDPDLARLQALKPGIDGAVRAIEATRRPADGLTDALPTWPVAYLMDQSEVFAGLRATVHTATALGDTDLANKMTAYADQMRDTVRTWDRDGMLAKARNQGGGIIEWSSWSQYFPDSMAQVWAAAFGIVTPQRSAELIADFKAHWPGWTNPESIATFDGNPSRFGYMPVAGWTLQGDLASATAIHNHALSVNRVWDYNSGVSGQLIIAATGWDTWYLADPVSNEPPPITVPEPPETPTPIPPPTTTSPPTTTPPPTTTTTTTLPPPAPDTLVPELTVADEDIERIRAEADWIMSATLPNGVIADQTDKSFTRPDIGAFAAAGLAAATAVTGDGQYVQAAWRYMEWYQSIALEHPQGFTHDYDITADGTLVSRDFFDSTDGYAAQFLWSLEVVYRTDPDLDRLRNLAPGMHAAFTALDATRRPDDLTGATPDFMVAYLMDNGGVYGGLDALSRLAEAAGEPALAASAGQWATEVQAALNTHWTGDNWNWAVHPDGAVEATNWSDFYTDSVAQLWPVVFGAATDEQAAIVTARILEHHPNWNQPGSPTIYNGKATTQNYWPTVGFAPGVPASEVRKVHDAALAKNHEWTWETGVAGQTILALTGWVRADAPPLTPIPPTTTPPTTTPPTTTPPTTTPPTTTPPPSAEQLLTAHEADWMLEARHDSGAITTQVDQARVDNTAAPTAVLGFARAFEVTADKRYADTAWDYLSWYASVQRPDGTVGDFNVEDGQLVDLGPNGSQAARAARFLQAVAATHRADPRPGELTRLQGAIARAYIAINTVRRQDGTVDGSPDWPVATLHNQADVYAGLTAASWLGDQGSLPFLSLVTGMQAEHLYDTIQTWWARGTYARARHQDTGVLETARWSRFYPDATAQIAALTSGLASPRRGERILVNFEKKYPQWTDPTSQVLIDGSSSSLGWFPSPALTPKGNPQAAALLSAAADDVDRVWDFRVETSAQIILAANGWQNFATKQTR